MIERINLIEKKLFVFTYGILMLGLGGIALLCVLLLGVQTLRTTLAEKKLARLNTEMTSLQNQQQNLMMTKSDRLDEGSGSELKKIFSTAPRWSQVLNDIGSRLPGSVWLTSFKGTAAGTTAGAAEKTADKNQAVGAKPIVLQGVARSPNDLALFLSQLNASPKLTHVILTSSKADGGSFMFTIESDLGK